MNIPTNNVNSVEEINLEKVVGQIDLEKIFLTNLKNKEENDNSGTEISMQHVGYSMSRNNQFSKELYAKYYIPDTNLMDNGGKLKKYSQIKPLITV